MTSPLPIVVTLPSEHHSSRQGRKIAAIVLHHTAGTDSRGWLTKNPQGVSAHVLIRRDGIIYRMVHDDRAAHHAGKSAIGNYRPDVLTSPNLITLAIELENTGTQDYPDAQMHACAYTVAVWYRRHSWLPILTHKIIDTKGKVDPAGFNGLDLHNRITAWLLPSSALDWQIP